MLKISVDRGMEWAAAQDRRGRQREWRWITVRAVIAPWMGPREGIFGSYLLGGERGWFGVVSVGFCELDA